VASTASGTADERHRERERERGWGGRKYLGENVSPQAVISVFDFVFENMPPTLNIKKKN
jgi:hypothetical protein